MESIKTNGSGGAGMDMEDVNKLRQYWHVVLERRWLIITIFTTIFILGVIYALRATPIYESKAILQIDPEGAGVLSIRDVAVNTRDQDYLQTQYRNLMSRSLIDKMQQQLRLFEDDRYRKSEDVVEAISQDITISPVRLTRLVEIKVRHPDPIRAQSMTEKLLELFLEENKTRKVEKALEAFRALEYEAKNQEMELIKADEEMHKYRVSKETVSLDEQANVIGRALIHAQEQYDIQRSLAAGAANLAEEARKWQESNREIVEFGEIAKDPLIMQIKGTLAEHQAVFAGLTNRYRHKHPEYVRAQSAIAATEKNLREEAQRSYEALVARAENERGKEVRAMKNLQEQEKQVEKLNELRVQYNVLRGKRERAEQMFQALLLKAKEYDISSSDIVQNMAIIDPAVLPLKPIKPNKRLIIVGAFISGLGMALGFAFFVNYLDDSIKSQDDVENYLRLPFLGYIPNIRTVSVVERDLQAHIHPTSTSAEGFRTLRAAVSLARNSDKLRCVAVSSTIPSEGKSLVASNFAIVTAQTGLRTLLVDADLRRPSVHKAFQLQSPLGLAAYLAERVQDVEDITHSTEVPCLDLVCCGSTPANPSELISSKRMLQFLEEVGKRYDRVILDCPPVSAVADPLVVGAMADGMIFVTKFNKIRREHAQRSVQRIQDANINLVGLILNDIDFEGKDSYYYSYHYYQNRYYSSHYRNRPNDPAGTSASKAPAAKPQTTDKA